MAGVLQARRAGEPVASRGARARAVRWLGASERARAPYIFLAPAAAFIAVLIAWPIVRNVELSFFSWNGVGTATFVGLRNYVDVVNDDRVRSALWNTLEYALATTFLTVLLGYVLAIAIERRLPGWVIFKVLYFFPVMLPLTMTGIIWGTLLDPTEGPINKTLVAFGVSHPPAWLGDAQWAMPALIAVTVWQFAGFPMIVSLAAMERIPREIQDAASIDGVGAWQRLRHITWPLTARVLVLLGVVQLIGGLKVFDIVFIMTNGGPGQSTEVMGLYLFRKAIHYSEVGYGATVAVVMSAVILLVSVVYLRLLRPQRVEL